MTVPAVDPVFRFTDSSLARPLPEALHAARRDVLAAANELATVPDERLVQPWRWKGGSEEELRYGFYRIGESFELAAIEDAAASRSARVDRGPAADRIAEATAARWDLQGLLLTLPDVLWDADPGGGEWTIRRTLGHVIASQRAYGWGTAWWATQGHTANDPALPASTPDELWVNLPTEEDEAAGSLAQVRARIDAVLDQAAERLAGLPADQLSIGARWSGFAVDVGFRLGRWSSHFREHTIQVEKTLTMLGHRPTEVQRLIRLVLAAWGRAEAVLYGTDDTDAGAGLARSAAEAHAIAREIAALARR